MKNKGCVNQGCTGCLWVFVYLIIFVIAISGLGFFGLSVGVIGAVLAYTSPTYREWLKNQRGFQSRLSKLPGMASSSPTTLALSTLAYTVPLSLISWSFLLGSFGKTDTTITAAIMGLIGLVLLFGWFIKGWGIPSAVTSQQGQTVNKVQDTQYFNRIRQLDEIRQLDPVAFERFVGSLFEKMGYQVQTTPLSGDEGIDLVLRKDTKLAIVQCKRYENSVGQPVVRDLYGAMVHNKADEAYLVTTGTVTLPAQQWVAGKPLHLVDGNTLVEWIETFKEQETSQPTNVITDETNNSKVSQEGIIGYFRQNPIASIVIPIALILPLCCCMIGTWVSPIVITPTPTPTPITPTPTKLPSTATLVPSQTPTLQATSTLAETVTFTPESTSTFVPTNTASASDFTILVLTSPVRAGSNATVRIQTVAGASCYLGYTTPSGTDSQAAGLGATTADAKGICSWTWNISPKTNAGTGSLVITANGSTQFLSIVIQ